MQSHFANGSNTNILPPLPKKKPSIKVEEKQSGHDNNGFGSSNLNVNPTTEKQYKKVVRRQPRPAIVDDNAAARIDARSGALQNRKKRADPNRSNEELEIDNGSDHESNKRNVHAAALANALNRNKGTPPAVISKKRKEPQKSKRETVKDDDMYDLPDYSRTNSELEAAKREGESSSEEEYVEEDHIKPSFSFNKNWFIVLGLALAGVAIVLASIAIGLAATNGIACEDGAVRLENNSPQFYKDGDWHSICGKCLQITISGTEMFCKELGYASYNQTVIPNGINKNSTNANETLAIESPCSGLNVTSILEEKGICEKGADTIQIECLNSTSLFKNRTSTC